MIGKEDAGISNGWIRGRREERRLRPKLLQGSESGHRSSRLRDSIERMTLHPSDAATFGHCIRKTERDHLTEGFWERSIQDEDTDNAPNMNLHAYCVPDSVSDKDHKRRR